MRLYCTSLTAGPVVQMPSVSMFTQLVVHFPIHQPFFLPQLPLAQASLSLSGVLNFLPLETQTGVCGVIIALPASPLYPATVSWYLPTSSLMENVEYSAEYHRPEVRSIYSQTHVTSDAPYHFVSFEILSKIIITLQDWMLSFALIERLSRGY